MVSLRIILWCIAAAVLYGVLHDLVTTRVCLEYFTVFHPPVFPTTSPTLLSLGWGFLATWWVGLILGIPASLAARAGSRPKLSARDLVRPTLVLLAVMGIVSLLSGIAGYESARSGRDRLTGELAALIPPEKHARFLADLRAHQAAYAAGFLGGIAVCLWIWRRRGKLS
jgi:H+/Cl- antiporter ClcA